MWQKIDSQISQMEKSSLVTLGRSGFPSRCHITEMRRILCGTCVREFRGVEVGGDSLTGDVQNVDPIEPFRSLEQILESVAESADQCTL